MVDRSSAGSTGTTGDYRFMSATKSLSDGSYAFPEQKPTATTTYKSIFAGDPSYDAVSSNLVTVTVSK